MQTEELRDVVKSKADTEGAAVIPSEMVANPWTSTRLSQHFYPGPLFIELVGALWTITHCAMVGR